MNVFLAHVILLDKTEGENPFLIMKPVCLLDC